jgi:hypothetical protein
VPVLRPRSTTIKTLFALSGNTCAYTDAKSVNADRIPERAPIENRSTSAGKLLGGLGFVHRLAGARRSGSVGHAFEARDRSPCGSIGRYEGEALGIVGGHRGILAPCGGGMPGNGSSTVEIAAIA